MAYRSSNKRSPVLQALSHRLRRFAKQGPAKFQGFLASGEFRERFNSVPPALSRRAIQAIVEAEALCARHDPLPPAVKAKPMGEGKKRSWTDPAQHAKLVQAYAIAGDDNAGF